MVWDLFGGWSLEFGAFKDRMMAVTFVDNVHLNISLFMSPLGDADERENCRSSEAADQTFSTPAIICPHAIEDWPSLSRLKGRWGSSQGSDYRID